MAIDLLCNMFLHENDWTQSLKPLVDIRVLTGHSRVKTVGLVTLVQCRSLTETLSHTLTLNQFFFSDSSRGFDETRSLQVHPDNTVALCVSCTPVLTFLNLLIRNVKKNGPIWVSAWPVPPRAVLAAPRGSLHGLSLRANSSLQTGFSLRSAGSAVTSTPTTGQSGENRKNPCWRPPHTHDDDQVSWPITAEMTVRNKAGARNNDQ